MLSGCKKDEWTIGASTKKTKTPIPGTLVDRAKVLLLVLIIQYCRQVN